MPHAAATPAGEQPPELRCDTPEDVLAAARSLAQLPAKAIELQLARLRLRYRSSPSLFTPESLQILREAGERLKQARPSTVDERALTALQNVFGYPAFLAGQREIIQAVMARPDVPGDLALDDPPVTGKKRRLTNVMLRGGQCALVEGVGPGLVQALAGRAKDLKAFRCEQGRR